MNNQQNAQELLEVLMNSQSHNPALALKEVLEKLHEQISGKKPLDPKDRLTVMYIFGYDECLNDIGMICNELGKL
jgi:hypothetical protein